MEIDATVIEWFRAQPADRVYLITEEAEVTYGEMASRIDAAKSPGVHVIRPRLDIDSVLALMTSMTDGAAVTLSGDAADPELGETVDAMTVVMTSGTSADPKAVRLTAANWKAAAEASIEHLGHGPDDTWLLALPLHHVAGLGVLIRSAMAGGSVRMQSHFEPGSFSAALHRVTMASLVPTMLTRVLDADPGPYHGLKAVLVGGGPIPDGLIERANDAGIPALPTYGMTETCGQVATRKPGHPPSRTALPLPGVEIRIRDDDRILVRGPMVSPGYVGEPDRDPDAWFVTGDLGIIENGELSVIGRADDVIITGGEKVSPEKVEAALVGVPGVTACLVVGIGDETWGEIVGCLYVGEVSPGQVVSALSGLLAKQEVPKLVKKVDEIPVTEVGKPDRSAVRRLFE